METRMSLTLVETHIVGRWTDGQEFFEFKPGLHGSLSGTCFIRAVETFERAYRIIELDSGIAMEIGPESCIIDKMSADEFHFWCGGRQHHLKRIQ